MTHSDELVERVARAVFDTLVSQTTGRAPKHDYDNTLEDNREAARELARAALSALPGHELLREALDAIEGCIAPLDVMSEDVGYGFARPDNPHDFSPDHECCNEDEIAAHKAACEAYDRGEYDPAATPGSIGAPGLHILRAPWGIGSYTMRDEQITAAVARARATAEKIRQALTQDQPSQAKEPG